MYNNPYMQYGTRFGEQPPYMQQTQQTIQQPISNQQFMPKQNIGLQGKLIDSIDVVKSVEIPLDGSISYFPTTDGSAIVSKKLQTDGTSKVVVYKPVEEDESDEKVEYLTKDDLNGFLKNFSIDEVEDIKDEIKELRKEIKDIKKGK